MDHLREIRRQHGDIANLESGGTNPFGTNQSTPLTPNDVTMERPLTLIEWTEFHSHVDSLPEDQRAVFELRWYQGFSNQQAASALKVDRTTVLRKWRSALEHMSRFLTELDSDER